MGDSGWWWWQEVTAASGGGWSWWLLLVSLERDQSLCERESQREKGYLNLIIFSFIYT
ncbi:hypothetical protein HanRHA438_Chr17g0812901 [Helianthus annuus]|nr:hypothetical protein HanIR_Chr04g0164021 [Helianthus annuus]KAJ0826311.1 hypothetical protein HanRHA438_Chr17g0812901 [Helianthus annuus]